MQTAVVHRLEEPFETFKADIRSRPSRVAYRPPSDEQLADRIKHTHPQFVAAISEFDHLVREVCPTYSVSWQFLGRNYPLSADPIVYAEIILRGKPTALHLPFWMRGDCLCIEESVFLLLSSNGHGMFHPGDDRLVIALGRYLLKYFCASESDAEIGPAPYQCVHDAARAA